VTSGGSWTDLLADHVSDRQRVLDERRRSESGMYELAKEGSEGRVPVRHQSCLRASHLYSIPNASSSRPAVAASLRERLGPSRPPNQPPVAPTRRDPVEDASIGD
jgi:hypothetical protein